MRSLMVKGVLAGLLAGSAFYPAGQARAGSAPSADEMIDALSIKDVARKCPTGVSECRGIRAASSDAGDVAPNSAASPRPGHRETVRKVVAASGSLDLSIEFPTGSAAITPGAAQQLSRLAQALSNPRLASSRFRIEGHTDTTGLADENQSLSEQRAASVVTFLENSFGIDKQRLEPIGLGEKDLAVPTPDQTAELRNRRVHIVNLGAS